MRQTKSWFWGVVAVGVALEGYDSPSVRDLLGGISGGVTRDM